MRLFPATESLSTKSLQNYFAKRAKLWIVCLHVAFTSSLCLKLTFSADDRLFPTKFFTPVDYSNAKKSDVQNYWDSNTCNTKWNFPGVEKGSKAYYDATKKRKYEIEPHIPVFAEYMRWKGKKVLEVGGGFCTTALDLALAGAILTVVDMSPTSLKLCRERFIAYIQSRIQ